MIVGDRYIELTAKEFVKITTEILLLVSKSTEKGQFNDIYFKTNLQGWLLREVKDDSE